MELTKKFQEAACSHAIRINSVELDRKYPIFQAERIVTKFGPTEKYILPRYFQDHLKFFQKVKAEILKT